MSGKCIHCNEYTEQIIDFSINDLVNIENAPMCQACVSKLHVHFSDEPEFEDTYFHEVIATLSEYEESESTGGQDE